MSRFWSLLVLVGLLISACGQQESPSQGSLQLSSQAQLPYDELADAAMQVQQTLAEAQAAQVPMLIIFGANWCPDCRALDASLHSANNAELINRAFRVVKVDVGNFDKNLELVHAYGNPIEKGIPAAVIVSSDNRVMYATRAGQLANARHMSDTGVYDFFKAAAQAAQQVQ